MLSVEAGRQHLGRPDVCPPALHDLLVRAVVQGHEHAVRQEQREVGAERGAKPGRAHLGEHSPQRERRRGEEDPVDALVVSEVDGVQGGVARLRQDLLRHEDAPKARHVAGVEPRVRKDPRDPGDQKDDDERGRDTVARSVANEGADARAAHGGKCQEEGDPDADGGERVRRLGVEVGLIDHAGPCDRRAQERRGDRGRDRRPACGRRGRRRQEAVGRDGQQRHGRDRDGPAQQHEDTRRAGADPGTGDVVEDVGGQAGVGDPHHRGDDGEDGPDRERLVQAGPGGIRVGVHATLRSGSIHMPSRGRSDTRAWGTTCRDGSSRRRHRLPSSARTSVASSIAKPTPMHLRVPPPNRG